jgi:glycosyl transferase family 1
MPVFEAAACGVPIISTPVGRVPELLVPDESYIGIPVSDAPAAGRALESLVHHPERLREYARRAYDSVAAALSVATYQSRHYEFYRRLSGSAYTEPRLTRQAIDRARRQWRAADSINSGKRLWADSQRGRALYLALRGLCLDPRSSAFWGVVLNWCGLRRRQRLG